jgi:hypothetical protein
MSTRLDGEESKALSLMNLLASPFLLPVKIFKLGRAAERNGEVVPSFVYRPEDVDPEDNEQPVLVILEDEYACAPLFIHPIAHGSSAT